jgi:hypothetical protein
MELSLKLQRRVLKQFQEAVDHQIKVWDAALSIAELLGLEQLDEVLSEVQAQSMTSETGRALTERDLEGFLSLEPIRRARIKLQEMRTT